MTKKNEIKLTASIVRELLAYDPHTGEFTWKPRSLVWFKRECDWKRWNKRFSGKPAGSVKTREDGTVFLRITIFDKSYPATKLVWIYMTGSWPEGYLTPVDGDSLNLRVDNLLEGYHGKGRSISSRNHSGSTGVSWDKRAKRWRAQVCLNGEYYSLGYFDLFSEAEEVVESFRREHGFLDRHGKALPSNAA